ncbi:hypothetical protein ACPPTR_09000 [Ralstonia pseudosolanacearum]|uniref:hypothetical protein n=1 Tax=Ralstonia pseudosolanacearum TaxID=1310165 RepID=UPI0018D0067E|nr:hypothetical protein [Ralstonia pseudosolanacearum]
MTTKYPRESGTPDSKPNTINLTPTWASCLHVFLAVLEDGTDEGKRVARQELARMAAAADAWNDHVGAQKAARATI